MTRAVAHLYRLLASVLFFFAFLYAVGFVTGLFVPRTVDVGPSAPWPDALLGNLGLMTLFAVPHSAMARGVLQRCWKRFLARPAQRSTYLVIASLALVLLFLQWRPMPAIVWQVCHPTHAAAITGVSLAGWLLGLASAFVATRVGRIGPRFAADTGAGRAVDGSLYRARPACKLARHAVQLSFIIAVWATPTMTAGHLLFAAVTTAYVVLGIFLDRRHVLDRLGDRYRSYRRRICRLVRPAPVGSSRYPLRAPATTTAIDR